jgi:hypothetical protein
MEAIAIALFMTTVNTDCCNTTSILDLIQVSSTIDAREHKGWDAFFNDDYMRHNDSGLHGILFHLNGDTKEVHVCERDRKK